VVEHHFATLPGLLFHIASAIRHGLYQLVQQAQVQCFGKPGPVQRLLMPTEAQQAFGHLDMLAQPTGCRLTEQRIDK